MLDAIRNGDDRALQRLYAEHRESFMQWFQRSYGLSDEDSKDLFQHAIVVFYSNLRSGKIVSLKSSPKTYLYGIGKNLAREWKRKTTQESTAISKLLEQQFEGHQSTEEKARYESNVRRMYLALNRLGDPCKSILKFFYLDRQSMENIAVLLGFKNAETVKSKKYKCLKRLKSIVQKLPEA